MFIFFTSFCFTGKPLHPSKKRPIPAGLQPRPRPGRPLRPGRKRKPKVYYHIKKQGCWKMTHKTRIFPNLLEKFRSKKNALKKCMKLANKKRYKAFALFNGRFCRSGRRVRMNYKRYGKGLCRKRGRKWPNGVIVYFIKKGIHLFYLYIQDFNADWLTAYTL